MILLSRGFGEGYSYRDFVLGYSCIKNQIEIFSDSPCPHKAIYLFLYYHSYGIFSYIQVNGMNVLMRLPTPGYLACRWHSMMVSENMELLDSLALSL